MTTTFLYAVLFGSYVYIMHTYIITDRQAQESAVQLSLTEFIPEVVPEAEVIEEEVVEVVPEEKPEPEPEPEPVVKEKPAITMPLPKPPVKKTEIKKKTPKKKIKKKKVKRHSAVNRKVGVRRQGSGQASIASKHRFLTMVRQRINRNKSYPRIAKKRGMQGSVKVRFTILPNGAVGDIAVVGPKVFRTSARRAIEKSFPIDTKKIPIALPKTVNLTLRYKLR